MVIAIIAILISLLMPALDTAQKEAHRAVCLSNLRQLRQGAASYAIDNNGYFPPSIFPNGSCPTRGSGTFIRIATGITSFGPTGAANGIPTRLEKSTPWRRPISRSMASTTLSTARRFTKLSNKRSNICGVLIAG